VEKKLKNNARPRAQKGWAAFEISYDAWAGNPKTKKAHLTGSPVPAPA